MSIKEFGQLKKFMMLTTSPNDNEAVAALRRANTIIATHHLTWDAVFARLVKVGGEIEDASTYDNPKQEAVDRRKKIEEALEFAMQHSGPDFKQFLQSLDEQLAQKGRLTNAQSDAIFKSARRSGWQG